MNGSCMGGCQVGYKCSFQHCLPAERGSGGMGGMRERKRTTDREKGEADEQTDVRGEGSETDD